MYLTVVNHHRNKLTRKRVQLALALATIVAGLTLATVEAARYRFLAIQVTSEAFSKVFRRGIEYAVPAPTARAERANFPFSVVPGGVLTAEEVQMSVARDPVLARHYKDVQITALQSRWLNSALEAYASYRVGHAIYWTRHKIRVPKGELVLTDGVHLLRARCGNRLVFILPPEEVPPPPPAIEPPYLTFEYGMPPIYAPPPIPTLVARGGPPPPLIVPPVPLYWPPVPPGMPVCCGIATPPKHPPGGGSGGGGGFPTPTTPTPEPSSWLLLGTAAAVMLGRKTTWRAEK